MNSFIPYKIYGIIGHPLGHSMSPMLHTTAFQALNIPAVLVSWPMEPDKLPVFVEAMRLLNIQGACVTIPHKQSIIPLLDEVTDRVKAVGAVNLIYREKNKICGDNTDVLGFIAPLQENPPAPDTKVLLLGAGGAARAVVAGLHTLGLRDITVAHRVTNRPKELSEAFNLKQVEWSERGGIPADMIINTTPLGMEGKLENETGYQAEWFKGRKGLAYDIVYTPIETRFIKEAQAAGWQTIGGLDMFIGQAEAQFRTWTGEPLPEAAIRTVINNLKSY